MFNSRFILATAIAAALLALTAGTAGAVEIGSRCAASGGGTGTRVQTAVVPGGPSYSAPTAGIVTKWGLTAPNGQSGTARLKILSYSAGDSSWTVLNQSESMSFVSGPNTFDTRIPIAAGNEIALFSPDYAAYCTTGVAPAETSALGLDSSNTPIGGSLIAWSFNYGTRTALFAVIEPDVDADGFGDESQDLCPQRADTQTACPAVSIASLKYKAGKKNLELTLLTSTQATVTLTASARIPATGGKRAKTIRFKMLTGTSSAAGSTVFTLKYPSKLRSALNSLPRRSKVKMTLDFSATGLVNSANMTYRVSLRGRA